MDANQLEDIAKLARISGADAAEIVFVASTDVTAGVRNGQQEALERSEHQAVGLRVWVGKKQAMVSSNDLQVSNLTALIETATSMAKASPADPYAGLAPPDLYATNIKDLDLNDTQQPDISQLQARCHEAENAALSIKGVTNSDGARANYGDQQFSMLISPASGDPFFGSYRTTNYSLSVSVLAGEGTQMEEDYEYSTKRFWGDLPDAASLGKKAGERVITRLNPKSIPTCLIPIIWEPRIAKSLLSQFLSAINGSAIARGSSFLKDKMGELVFDSAIQIVDDPHLIRGLSSKPFDAEGVANGKLDLIKNGVLQQWLLDVRSANKLGLTTNGRAGRGLSSPPSPGSTNCYMAAGNQSPNALMQDIQKGLLVTDVFGMGVNQVTGDYSQGARGFLIENGRVTTPVSEITIAGNLLDMFKQLTPANDLNFDYGTNAPTLRINGMTVAGS